MRRGEIIRNLNADYYHPERRLAIKTIQESWKDKSSTLGAELNFSDQTCDYEPGLFYVGLANIESEKGSFVDTNEEEPEGICRLFKQGDVLYGKLRPYLNKVYIAPSNGQCSTEFYALSPKDAKKIDCSFLSAFLMSEPFLAQTIHMMTGNTHPRIQKDDFCEILVPLPALDVQRALVAEMQAARAARQSKLAEAEELLKGMDGFVLEQLGLKLPEEENRSTFAIRPGTARIGRLDVENYRYLAKNKNTLQGDYPNMPLSKVAEIVMGQAPEGKEYNDEEKGLPLIAGAADLGEIYPSPDKWTTAAPKRCRAGDIILCIRATIGTMNWADREYCLGRGVAGIRPNKKLVNEIYLYETLWMRRHYLMSRGTGSTFKQVIAEEIEKCPIPLPPLEIQKSIAAELSRRRGQARRLREEAESGWREAKEKFEKKLLDG